MNQELSPSITPLAMSQKFLHIVPIRFSRAQLAVIDQKALQLKTQRSTLIRDTVLQTLAIPPAPSGDQVSPFAKQETNIML